MNNKKLMHFKLPSSFFKKVLSDYNDWKFAWFREILQNLIDAKANIAKFEVEKINDTQIKITVTDNGHGMTEDVLINGFMSLGGSIKDDTESVGGFGVASMMIAQSHESYVIKTQDLICEGSTGTYTISKSSDYIEGCIISVVMRISDIATYNPINHLKSKVIEWSKYANIKDLKIEFNGEDVSPCCTKYQYSIESQLGKVKFNEVDNGYGSVLYIRLKNQPMFCIKTYSENVSFEGVLDLDGNSIDLLTSNRDGLSGNKSGIVSNILKELSTERSKYKIGDINNFILNKSCVFPKEYKPTNNQLNDLGNQFVSNILKSDIDIDDDNKFKGLFKKEENNFNILKDKINNKINKVAKEYYPLNFSIKYTAPSLEGNDLIKYLNYLVDFLNKRRTQKMAWTLQYLLSETLDLMIIDKDINKYNEYRKEKGYYYYLDRVINFGFIFDKNLYGLNSQNDKEITISINLESFFNLDFDIDDLLDISFHELAHIEYNDHSDFFRDREFYLRRMFRKNMKPSVYKNNLDNFVKYQLGKSI